MSLKYSKAIIFLFLSCLPVERASAGDVDIGTDQALTIEAERWVSEITEFNWAANPDVLRTGAGFLMWEPLFSTDQTTGELQPWLALTHQTSSDGLVVTIGLRDGVLWSDDTAFTASNVAHSINAVISSNWDAPNAIALRKKVAAVSCLNSHTIQMTLKQPDFRIVYDYFATSPWGTHLVMRISAGSRLQGCDAFVPPDQTKNMPLALGTGPYVLESINGNIASWRRREDWWASKKMQMPLPEPLQVTVQGFDDAQARTAALTGGFVDISLPLTGIEYELMRNDDHMTLSTWRDSAPYGFAAQCVRSLEFNTHSEGWSEPARRIALARLVDRQEIASLAYDGNARPTHSLFPGKGEIELSEEASETAADGLPTLHILVPYWPAEFGRAADVLARSLRRKGIDVEVEKLFQGDYESALADGKFDATYGVFGCGSSTDPYASLARYSMWAKNQHDPRLPMPRNIGGWDSLNARKFAAYAYLIGRKAPGHPAIPGLLSKAIGLLSEDLPVLPLIQTFDIVPTQTARWQGWPDQQSGQPPPAHWRADGRRFYYRLTANSP